MSQFQESPAPYSPVEPLHVCPRCSSPLMHPLDDIHCGDGSWELLLRCPTCTDLHRASANAEQFDNLEEHLARCIADLMSDLAWLEEAAMEDWVVRFSLAIANDQILPEDF